MYPAGKFARGVDAAAGVGVAARGIAVPLTGDAGVLLNLSFGYAVRDAVREKKLDEAYADWMREARARAYVELREPPQL